MKFLEEIRKKLEALVNGVIFPCPPHLLGLFLSTRMNLAIEPCALACSLHTVC